jgi:hypothetical protein
MELELLLESTGLDSDSHVNQTLPNSIFDLCQSPIEIELNDFQK